MFVAQVAEGSLSTPEIRSSYPNICPKKSQICLTVAINIMHIRNNSALDLPIKTARIADSLLLKNSKSAAHDCL